MIPKPARNALLGRSLTKAPVTPAEVAINWIYPESFKL